MLCHSKVHLKQLQDGTEFQRRIPTEYHFHLAWIQQESKQNYPESAWLRNVMDHFAEELLKFPSVACPSWRSASLNSLLMRAFNNIFNNKATPIEKFVSSLVGEPEMLNIVDWQEFYFDANVINCKYDTHWASRKPQTICPNNRNLP
jgi:hypothetical protein